MELFLFLEREGKGWRIRPCAFREPSRTVTPMYLEPTQDRLAWMARFGVVQYDGMKSAEENCRQFYNLMGEWPMPYVTTDVLFLDEAPDFDDSLEGVGAC